MEEMLRGAAQAGLRVLLAGPPGCGKTARIRAVANALSMRLVVSRMSTLDRIDVSGAIVPDVDAGIARILPLELIQRLKTSSTESSTLWLWDDLGQAPAEVQSALFSLLDESELPKNVLVWGATNRAHDRAGCGAPNEALMRSRFHLRFAVATPADQAAECSNGAVYLAPWSCASAMCDACELCGWLEWARGVGAPPELLAWHRGTRGRTLYAWTPSLPVDQALPDYRAWETVMALHGAGLLNASAVGAAVGVAAAAEYLTYVRLAGQLASPAMVVLDPTGATCPTDAGAMYLQASLLASAARRDTVASMLTYMRRMPRIYQALYARDAARRLGEDFYYTPEAAAWWRDNQALFS